jgi:hypothetical protein
VELELSFLAESGLRSLGVCACDVVIEGLGVEVAGGVSLAIWGTCSEGASVAIGDVEAHPVLRRVARQVNAIKAVFEIDNCMGKA